MIINLLENAIGTDIYLHNCDMEVRHNFVLARNFATQKELDQLTRITFNTDKMSIKGKIELCDSYDQYNCDQIK